MSFSKNKRDDIYVCHAWHKARALRNRICYIYGYNLKNYGRSWLINTLLKYMLNTYFLLVLFPPTITQTQKRTCIFWLYYTFKTVIDVKYKRDISYSSSDTLLFYLFSFIIYLRIALSMIKVC